MLPKLKISEYLLKRLEKVKQECSGCLFGVFYGEGTLLLMGFNVESTIGQLNYEQIQHKFPTELDLCGLVKFGDCSDVEAHLTEVFKDVDITDNPILLHCELGTLVGLKASFLVHGKLQQVPYDIMYAEELFRDFCFTRLKCTWTIYCEASVEAVRRQIHKLRKMLSGGSLAFNVQSTRIFITNTSAHGYSLSSGKQQITNESPIKHIINALQEVLMDQQEDKENMKNTKKSNATMQNEGLINAAYGAIGCPYDIINIEALRCKTRDQQQDRSDGQNKALPALSACVRTNEHKFSVPIEIEPMAILNKYTKISRLYDVLIESICRALRLSERSIIDCLDELIEFKKLGRPCMYNFRPQEFDHFVSCCYLENISDDNAIMQEKRKRLHRHFGLPVTRPYFRRSNACIYYNEILPGAPLLNTHIGVKPSGVIDGKQSLVQGNYYYYHYLQQNIQDKGWGCAYRSLQTICSWFLLQGYTDSPVPVHSDIQEYLVKIGDKPKTFKGSYQWIGSTEVGMCLQGFLNVDSKIHHVSSGGELSMLASDLIMHFQTQGTPIMIGGGVLAHTIIGIDYCMHTNQVKFLILDPHYTGEDDLQIIQNKGWCGWKGIDFWDKKSYYNLCMPQRPIMF